MGKLTNFSKACWPWIPHLSIYVYIDLIGIWSWLGFSGNFAMICMGNVFTVFDLIRFCMKQSRQNSRAKGRFFKALTGGKICMLLNIPIMIWQLFDFGTIIVKQALIISAYQKFRHFCKLVTKLFFNQLNQNFWWKKRFFVFLQMTPSVIFNLFLLMMLLPSPC